MRLSAPLGTNCSFAVDSFNSVGLLGGGYMSAYMTTTMVPCPPSWEFINGTCVPCEVNKYSFGGTSPCLPCLKNMICGTSLTQVASGYYPTKSETGELVLQKCVGETCCTDKYCPFDVTLAPEAEWASCSLGFAGPLCLQCLPGRVHWGGACVGCSDVSWGYGLLLLLITFLVAFYLVVVPSISTDATGGELGWTTIHHKFVSRVLIFQTLAPILREHEGWTFLRAIEVISLNLDLGPQVCMGNFPPLGRVASVVLFPFLLFPLALSLAVISKCIRKKAPSVKELVLSLAVLCVQPCLRSAASMVSCITVGSEFVMASTGVPCYEGNHLAAAVFSWLFLVLFTVFALVGLLSRCKPQLIVFFPENNLLNRLIVHAIVTVIAAADGDSRDSGVAFITLVLGVGIYFQGLDNNFPGFWLQTGGWLGLVLVAILEFLAADASVREPSLIILTFLVVMGVVESVVAIIREFLRWRGVQPMNVLKSKV